MSKRVSKTVIDCPNISETIEAIVKDQCWRRCVASNWCSHLDGNANLKDKVTYTKIQKHLEKVYQRKFAFGTVI